MSNSSPMYLAIKVQHRFLKLIILAGIMLSLVFFLLRDPNPRYTQHIPTHFTKLEIASTDPGTKFAYATFLSSTRSDDPYVTATRVMAYQLLHDPHTRTKRNIPFLVLVPPHVPRETRKSLQEDGAQIIQVDQVTAENWRPRPGAPRWADQFSKLRLFELEAYDRILYMDSDMLITRCMDAIWDEDEVRTEWLTGSDPRQTKDDEMLVPGSYALAGVAGQGSADQPRPKPILLDSIFSGGFFVLKPSKALFEYYVSVLNAGTDGRFEARMMEMGLLNYAHRFDGNMPWTPLKPGRWNMNWPAWYDVEVLGSATLHDKFWESGNKDWIDRRLVDMWWKARGQMEGFWTARGRNVTYVV